MMYTLDISGQRESGAPGITRFGGLFLTIDDAARHGQEAAGKGRFFFKPEVIWVRDERGEVVRQDKLA